MLKSFLSIELKKIKNGEWTFGILRTSYFVGLVTLSYKLLFVLRDLIVAWTFGRSQSLEAFILAFLIPYAFINALAESLSITFLPNFIELRENKQFKLANDIYSELLGILLLISFVAMLLLLLSYPLYAPIVAASFSVEGLSLMNFLLYFTAPAAILTSITILWKSILNAKEKFIQSALVSIITPLISVLLLVFVSDLGVFVLSLGLLIGAVLELILLGVLLKALGFHLLPQLNIFSLKLKIPLGDWWRVFISISLFNSMVLINGFMAARRAEIGGLSILNYGKKIVTLPTDISAITYSSVLIPYLSKIRAAKNWGNLSKVLEKWMLIIFLTSLPVIIGIIFSADHLVKLLYERGAFTSEDTQSVSIVLIYYIFQLPFYAAFYVLLRVLPVIQKNNSSIYFGILGVVLTFVFNFFLIRNFGTAGIAISTSCVYFCLAIALFIYVKKVLSIKSNKT